MNIQSSLRLDSAAAYAHSRLVCPLEFFERKGQEDQEDQENHQKHRAHREHTGLNTMNDIEMECGKVLLQ